ncbi:MAG TPA: alpha/beta hydrolase [Nitrososphaeraceae archaeon]|nr:alpha/beta hydrolase [Nitrososphaeraceae archaeon]
MKKQFHIVVIIALISILSFAIINDYDGMTLINAQRTIDLDNNTSDNTNILDLKNIPSKQVRIGDIDVSYKKFGNGDPILLIMGYSGSKNDWDPTFLKRLSANHTVIIFDNRGVSNSTLGTKDYTINQLAEDIVGLLNVLNIDKVDILGYSMGGMIAQQLTLDHEDKVDDLIIYASYCGTIDDQTYYPPKKLLDQFGNLTGTEDDKKERFVPYQFSNSWINQNRASYDRIFASLHLPPNNILEKQKDAIFKWIPIGTCDRLSEISQDTLIIVGTSDKIIPSINSEIFKDKIKGAKVETFIGGGHALMFQFPEKFTEVINTFLDK